MSKPEDHCLYTPAKDIFPTRTAIRSLEIKFLAEYIPTNYHEERLRELWKSQEFREQRRKSKAEYFHALDLSASKAVWLVAGKLLCLLNGLKVLTIDFELAFCPEGCCRVAEDVVKSLRKLLRRTDLELKVKGTLDDDEHRIITNALRARSKGSDASDDNTESDESSDDEANSDGDGSDDNSSSSSSDNDGDVEGED